MRKCHLLALLRQLVLAGDDLHALRTHRSGPPAAGAIGPPVGPPLLVGALLRRGTAIAAPRRLRQGGSKSQQLTTLCGCFGTSRLSVSHCARY